MADDNAPGTPPGPPPTPPPAPAPKVVAPEVFTALVDLHYGNTLVKAGNTANDIPAESVKWLLEQKLIKREVT